MKALTSLRRLFTLIAFVALFKLAFDLFASPPPRHHFSTTSNQRVALVTFAQGESAESVARITIPNKQRYADIHGYDFFNYGERIAGNIHKTSIYFTKFASILSLFDHGYDFVIWSDSDAIFLNHSQSMQEFLDPQYDLIVPTAEPDNAKFKGVVNLGHFIFKNSAWSRAYIHRFLALADLAACTPLDGKNLMNGWLEICDPANGRFWLDDQGLMLWTFDKWGRDVDCHVKRVSFYHFDSEFPWFHEGDLVVHLPGRPSQDRIRIFEDMLAITHLKTGKMDHKDPRFHFVGPMLLDSANIGGAERRRRLDVAFEEYGWNRVCGRGEGEISVLAKL
ncbi:hypothetical protein HDU98_006840 [Podochytrium sp. JEL0797]|nr:hypothetical protein HDU98_006840 [Podochytrium sp. JEL0797]